jgi:pyridoxamine 5'-phosphate oxidase
MSINENTPIADLRQDYSLKTLDEKNVLSNPIEQFKVWFEEAQNAQIHEPNAMFLATVHQNKPSGRVVLLKGIELENFVFFTNYNSRKGKEILENQHVSLTFLWVELERQVRIEGIATKADESYSTHYFHSRPRKSQLGAIASPQSQKIENRDVLEKQFEEFEKKYENQEIPKPEDWGGYFVKPSLIEFWQGRRSRLHDRILYENIDNLWQISRLAP